MAQLNLTHRRVLLVDDVVFSRQVVSKMLSDMGQPEIFHAENGNEALDVLHKEEKIDFIISDFHMPGINGLQLLKAIREGKTGAPRDIPFAMLTGYSDRYLVDMALALDVNAFLAKPVSKNALADRLQKMLTRDDTEMAVKPPEVYEAVIIEEAEEEQEQVKEPPNRDIKLKNVRETQQVMSKMSSLSGKFQTSDLAQNITTGFDKLVTDAGSEEANRVAAYIDDLVKRNILDIEDVPGVLDSRKIQPDGPNIEARLKKVAGVWAKAESGQGEEEFYPLQDIPLGAFLSQDLLSEDGSLFVKKDIPLTQQVVAILAHLGKVGAVMFQDKDGATAETEGSGVLANFQAGEENDGQTLAFDSESPPSPGLTNAIKGNYGWEQQVPADEIPEGATLARDIYTVDGRRYMYAGSLLTKKVISILCDLQDLENLQSRVWITIPKT